MTTAYASATVGATVVPGSSVRSAEVAAARPRDDPDVNDRHRVRLETSPGGGVVVLLAIGVTVLLAMSGPPSVAGPGGAPTASPTPVETPSLPTSTPMPTQPLSPSPTPTATPAPVPTPVPTPAVTPAPTPIAPAGPPACRYDDVVTPRHAQADWPVSLLDTIYRLPAEYAPTDLVDSAAAGVNSGYLVRALIAEDLAALADAARAHGTPIRLVSGYRSHAQQHQTFQYWVELGGYERALRTSARAGHSEHQLGTTIDVTGSADSAPWEYADWATTPTGSWMAVNAWRHGFVMSYPRDAFDAACYDYEPWHYRYVGRELAIRIHEEGRVPRLVLWELQ
jgi:D-alanyl-D-alanine carboxypeptidase